MNHPTLTQHAADAAGGVDVQIVSALKMGQNYVGIMPREFSSVDNEQARRIYLSNNGRKSVIV